MWGVLRPQESLEDVGNEKEEQSWARLPTVGVVAALSELVEEMEEVLSARARGAIGGGLDEWMGGLKGLDWRETKNKIKKPYKVKENPHGNIGIELIQFGLELPRCSAGVPEEELVLVVILGWRWGN